MSYAPTTIAALATAPSPAGVAVLRLSGLDSKNILKAIFLTNKINPIEDPRTLVFGKIINPNTNEILDHCLAVFFAAPNSYTGEDLVEFQIHGSPLLAQKILRVIYENGAIPAEPGEFTKRAFLNGKIDLSQAEAVADLISAPSERALSVASDNLSGKLSQAITEFGEPLRDTLAEIEARLDFPEEDIEPDALSTICERIANALNKINGLLKTFDYGKSLKEGTRVLICGRPNAGKSSLLNELLGSKRAIVTDISGTTRDLIEESALIDGYQFVFCDSAGIRETDNTIEKLGIELAIQKIAWADIVFLVTDATQTESQMEIVNLLEEHKAREIWQIINKVDLLQAPIFTKNLKGINQTLKISTTSKIGLSQLRESLVRKVSSQLPSVSEASAVISNERQRLALTNAARHLKSAAGGLTSNLPLELISSDIKTALQNLEEIIGVTSTEDILGRIFSKFCIGK